MNHHFSDNITLTGEEAARMADMLYRPSSDYLNNLRKTDAEIRRGLRIRMTESGVEADVEGLDLSFLHNNTSITLRIPVSITGRDKADSSVYHAANESKNSFEFKEELTSRMNNGPDNKNLPDAA